MHRSSGLFKLHQRTAEVLRMQEQHRVAMGADRIGSLVIRKKENDIGATGVR